MSYYFTPMSLKQTSHYVASQGIMNAVYGGTKTTQHQRESEIYREKLAKEAGAWYLDKTQFVSGLDSCKIPT